MKIIDVSTWNRRTSYENFIKYTNPIFSISSRLDVTELVKYCKENKKTFFPSFLYIVTEAVNAVEEMRTRIVDGKIVNYDTVNPSYIIIHEDEELTTCMSEANSDFEKFYSKVRKQIDDVKTNHTHGFNSKQSYDCIYISCLPWLDIMSVSNPYNLADASVSSIPRITWGKYTENAAGRLEMGVDIAAHHALIDGRQVVRVFEKMIDMLNDINNTFGGER